MLYFFNNAKQFCLRGGEEHRNLKFSQFERTENRYIYTENSSKNRSGGLAQLNVKHKYLEMLKLAITVIGNYLICA